MLIRAAKLADIDRMMNLSTLMGEGMTSMPHDYDSWERKLTAAEKSFAGEVDTPGGELYQLVLVDEDSDLIMGTCAVFAAVGLSHPFYSYKVSRTIMRSIELGITADTQVLHLVNDFTGMSELASLFLQHEFRSNPDYPSAGRFLSTCRYLMLAEFREKFSDHVFAEIRGWIDEDGVSPFWEAIGKHFFDLPFTEADFISAVNGTQFVADLMPKDPVHVNLLSAEAQAVIGKPNRYSLPAMKMLEAEGFYFNNYIDIFDGGPTIQCKLDQIESVRLARRVSVCDTTGSAGEANTWLISNGRLENYRIIMADTEANDEQIVLSDRHKRLLDVVSGDEVHFLPLKRPQ